jgi:hypothetical protein
MAIDLKPMRWDWAAVTQGDTLPAINLVDTAATFALTRVLVTIEPKDSDVAALTLDSSTTGVTINVATAGAWDYTIASITAAQTATLTPGFYTVNVKVFGTNVAHTDFKGEWEILEK